MLRIEFLNVGDGDCILLREQREGKPDFVALVDTGRPQMEYLKGSLRREAVAHLMKAGLDHIDLMVLTHLHMDHIGGALRVMRHFPVKRLLAGYFPPRGAHWIFPPTYEEKSIVGLCESLNMFADITACAEESGCDRVLARAGELPLTDTLHAELSTADTQLLSRQKEVFNGLYQGKNPGHEQTYRVSKERNCSSLVIRFHYAARSVLLMGDSYASYWESREETHCDILKVSHHGDEKSMTQKLLDKLTPEYAIITGQLDACKERPAPAVMALLRRHDVRVLCTECAEGPGYGLSAGESVRLCIHEDGSIECPAQ